MNPFKVGDRVRVKSGVVVRNYPEYGGIKFHAVMRTDQVLTVRCYNPSNGSWNLSNDWNYRPEWLEAGIITTLNTYDVTVKQPVSVTVILPIDDARAIIGVNRDDAQRRLELAIVEALNQ